MSNPIELVVFDIAGTTVADDGEIALAFQQAMQNYGYTIAVQKINPLMGYKKPEAIKKMLLEFEADNDKITDDFVNEIHDRFLKEMVHFYQTTEEIKPLPNALRVFEELKQRGIQIGLDTGFGKPITDVIMDRLGWLKNDIVQAVVSSSEVPEGRPKPHMINEIMRLTGVTDTTKIIKIGDTEVDVMEGKNAGCLYSIAITTGAFTREALEPYEPSFIINDLAELLPIINNVA